MPAPVIEAGQTVNLTATGDIYVRNCALIGFYVNSTTAGTAIFRRGGSAGTVLNGVITPAIGFHAFPADCPGGAHVTVGGTLDVTFFFVPA